MIKYVGNSNEVIDWDEVILGLQQHDYETHPGPFKGPTHKAGDDLPGLNVITDLWTRAGYKPVEEGGTVQWDMFHPGVHFDQSVVDKFVKYFDIQDYSTAWISRIHPGNFAPWHWDITDDEKKLLAMPERPRWHCHIGKKAFGHIFIANDICFYNQDQGASYMWDDRRYWHAGTNCGLEPKYLFNIW
jgi:hypothetical protein